MSDKFRLLTLLTLIAPGMAGAVDEPLFDPTRPLIQTTAAGSKAGAEQIPSLPRLQAVFAQGHKHSALIDGQRLSVGEAVGNYRITAISTSGVELMGPKGTIQLYLGLSSMKKLAQETRP